MSIFLTYQDDLAASLWKNEHISVTRGYSEY